MVDDQNAKPSQNTCESHDDCGSGLCDPMRNICIAEQGEIGTVLVQITAPSDSGAYSLLSFLQTAHGLPSSGGKLDWTVPAPAELHAEVYPAPQPAGSTCVPEYGAAASESVPVSVRFRATEQVFGLAASDIQADSEADASTGSYRFKARMPPGIYDVYVTPDASAIADEACLVVPQVFRNFEVSAGQASEPLPLYLETPSMLKVIVDWPITGNNTGKSLEGWHVDILDPVTGWVLSHKTTLELDQELSDAETARYVADVAYTKLHDPELEGKELVRISPPIDPDTDQPVIAPTFVIDRKAVELLKAGEAQVDHITSLPEPISVELSVFDADTAKAIETELTLRFVSKQLYLEPNGVTPTAGPVHFSTETISQPEKFYVDLLPGEYDVYAIPTSIDSNVAVTRSSLTVKAGVPQVGKSIVIDTTTQLQGVALGPNGDPVVGAKVRATASPTAVDPVWLALGLKAPKPLSADGVVSGDGSFTVPVHPGTLDVSIRPGDATGFAWLVRPNVAVENGIHDLGSVGLPLPVHGRSRRRAGGRPGGRDACRRRRPVPAAAAGASELSSCG